MTEDKSPKAVVYHDGSKRTVGVTIEKRGLNRIPVSIALYVKTSTLPKPVFAEMVDFSGSGARLLCKEELKVEQIVELLPDLNHPSFATAKVVRRHPKKPEYGIIWVQMNEEMIKGLFARKKL